MVFGVYFLIMVDQVTEVALPWVETPVSNEKLSLEILGMGVDWLKGNFRTKWGNNLLSLENARGKKQEVLRICTELASLQRDLAYYLFIVSQNKEFLKELERPITEALFGEAAGLVSGVLGSDRRNFFEGSLVGVISNLTLWYLIAESRPDLSGRLDFGQMVVGGVSDAQFGVDVVFDFGTKTK